MGGLFERRGQEVIVLEGGGGGGQRSMFTQWLKD